MDALRVSLLIIGIAIIVAIYFVGRRHLDSDDRRLQLVPAIPWSDMLSRLRSLIKMPAIRTERGQSDDTFVQPPPAEPLADEDIDSLNHIVTDRNDDEVEIDDLSVIVELSSEQIAPAGERLFIPVTVHARNDQRFDGQTLKQVFDELGMVAGEDGLFRYVTKDNAGYEQTLLGLANIMEPGTFDLANLDSFETPGLVLYLHLPAPIEPREAFDALIETGRKLASMLDADFCDETRSVLTNQTIGHLKEKVEAYRFRQKMTSIKQRRP